MTAIRRFLGGALAGIERVAASAARFGLGTLVWAILIGFALGLTIAIPANSQWMAGLSRRSATASTWWPTVVFVPAAICCVLLGLGVLASVRRREPNAHVDWIRRLVRRWSWIVAVPVLLALSASIEASNPIVTAFLCIAVGLLAAHAAYFWIDGAPADQKPTRWRRLAPALLALCALAYTIWMTRLALINHWNFKTNRADLGFYMSVFRHSSLGDPLGCSLCLGGTHASGHFDPILVLLSPLYLIHPFSETLLVLQTLWLVSGVIPLYLLTKHKTDSPRLALALSSTYLLHPALHGVNLFDFHSLSLVLPVFLWLIYSFETGRLKAYAAFAFLALLCREDIALPLTCVGIMILFSKKPYSGRVSLLTVGGAVVYFLFVKTVMMTSSDPLNADQDAVSHAYYFGKLIPKGTSTQGLVGTLVSDPFLAISQVFEDHKIQYLLILFGSLLFMPLLGRGRIQLMYGFVLTLLATRPTASVNFHYSSLLLPFLFTLSADAFERLDRSTFGLPKPALRRLRGALAIGIVAATAATSWKFGAFVPNRSFRAGLRPQARSLTPKLISRVEWLHNVALKLPRDTSITAGSGIVPHLGRIRTVYLLGSEEPSDYVVYASSRDARVRRAMDRAIRSGHLVEIDRHGKLKLYRNTKPGKPWMTAERKPARKPKASRTRK